MNLDARIPSFLMRRIPAGEAIDFSAIAFNCPNFRIHQLIQYLHSIDLVMYTHLMRLITHLCFPQTNLLVETQLEYLI